MSRRVADYDFDLPEDRIALRPVRPRSAARLLVARGPAPEIADRTVADLPGELRPGDLLLFNDTRVIPARLTGERRRETPDGSGAARVEATLLEPLGGSDWSALARPAKRLRPGDRIAFPGGLAAEVAEVAPGGATRLSFDRAGPEFDAALARAGAMPLPPYIARRRAPDAADEDDYQTVFAERPGAVAAPTAALHFDDTVLAALEARGVRTARLTLHVGAGTFLPVTAEALDDHRMHSERGALPAATARAVTETRAAGGRVIPVGTTALRVLETAAAACGLEPGEELAAWEGSTDLFVAPGFRFRATDGLMTNFHLPRSTLLMLVSALMGMEAVRRIYAHAVAEGYRFYSYGDASLLLPAALGAGARAP